MRSYSVSYTHLDVYKRQDLDTQDTTEHSSIHSECLEPEQPIEEESLAANKPSVNSPKLPQMPSLHYNIEIHLPATKDIEVYNAIFKSIKEHLFE